LPRILINKTGVSGKELEMLNKFWKENGQYYSKKDQIQLRNYLLPAYDARTNVAFYLSIFSFLDLLPEKRDLYAWFLEYLKAYYPNFLEKNILEVSCGSTPALVKKIAYELKESGSIGSIMGIDPKISIPFIDNAKLLKKNFTYNTDLSNVDTIIGIAPCEVTPVAIKRACIEQKELSLLLCGCTHMDGNCFYPTYEAYLNHLFNIVKYHISKDFMYDITYTPASYDYEYPLLSLKRK